MFVPTRFEAGKTSPEIRDQLIQWLLVNFPSNKKYNYTDVCVVETLDEHHTAITYFLKDHEGNYFTNPMTKKRASHQIIVEHEQPLTILV